MGTHSMVRPCLVTRMATRTGLSAHPPTLSSLRATPFRPPAQGREVNKSELLRDTAHAKPRNRQSCPRRARCVTCLVGQIDEFVAVVNSVRGMKQTYAYRQRENWMHATAAPLNLSTPASFVVLHTCQRTRASPGNVVQPTQAPASGAATGVGEGALATLDREVWG